MIGTRARRIGHDEKELAFLLVWVDRTHDATAMRPQDFRDAVALEFPTAGEPPFFAMGQPGAPVNIWMWKAARQADLEPAFQDLEKVYPNLGIDSYPNIARSALEQPSRHALTLESNPLFVTAWGAGNVVCRVPRRRPCRGSGRRREPAGVDEAGRLHAAVALAAALLRAEAQGVRAGAPAERICS